MFQFAGWPPDRLCVQRPVAGLHPAGFPHSDVPGSTPVCGSPRLIAACHVLLRPKAPRHPPYALIPLTVPRITRKTALSGRAYPTSYPRSPLYSLCCCQGAKPFKIQIPALVETSGIEPPTSCLQGRRSPAELRPRLRVPPSGGGMCRTGFHPVPPHRALAPSPAEVGGHR